MYISFQEVCKKYRRNNEQIWGLRESSFSLDSGSTTLITGPNGSGKSTLLSLLGGIIRPTTGRIYCDETEISGLGEPFRTHFRHRSFGYHFQEDHLLSGLSISENIMLAALPGLSRPRAVRQRIQQLLDAFGVGATQETRVEQLSGGQRQKVSLARALVNDPPVLLADEPTNHLDEQSATEIRSLLAHLPGKTVVVISHDPVFSEEFAFDQRLLVDDGNVHCLRGRE
ncbi:MAG: ABC transporter ATP-binding protein [Deltaproteobacteria bacterium]|nr:MAG: ABC transporter ATP-binding protein [Deltaproteobacteria bacterium]PIE72917.1 MAG: ABC transporter ATP-binding protein [Deltaproteobacteria bacterium]